MTISVIIPVYKVEKYVRRCIESVVAQECDNFNLECLIIDDCTPDNSMAIVQDVINGYTGTSIAVPNTVEYICILPQGKL